MRPLPSMRRPSARSGRGSRSSSASHETTPRLDADYIVNKVVNLRVFADEDGKFNLSAMDVRADLLLISQFTLHADTRKGRRPSFIGAAGPDLAAPLFDLTVGKFRETGLRVETGVFQAYMMVSLTNDGPVTIMIDSADKERPRRG